MSVEATSETMRSYPDALLSRSDFTDDVTWTIVGARLMDVSDLSLFVPGALLQLL